MANRHIIYCVTFGCSVRRSEANIFGVREYFVATIGNVTVDVIAKYLKEQDVETQEYDCLKSDRGKDSIADEILQAIFVAPNRSPLGVGGSAKRGINLYE